MIPEGLYAALEERLLSIKESDLAALREAPSAPGPFPTLSGPAREAALQTQADLDDLLHTAYAEEVLPCRGSPSHEDAWRSFSSVRAALVEEASRKLFGDAYMKFPDFRHLSEPLFDEDRDALDRSIEEEVREAKARGVGPRRVPVPEQELVSWSHQEQQVDAASAGAIRAILTAAGWPYVFHVTRLERLQTIAVYGVLDGLTAQRLHPGGVERESRGQSDAGKEFLHSVAVSSGFWPAWWAVESLGLASAVILAIDAAALATQRSTCFVPSATRTRKIQAHQLVDAHNGTPEGLDALRGCWTEEAPPEKGYAPRSSPEILSARIHPRHLRVLIFPSREAEAAHFGEFRALVRDNYDDVALKSAAEAIWLDHPRGRKRLGFPT